MSTASPPFAPAPQIREAPLSYRLARRVTEYARLMRLDRPVGTWLLLWPALWALWIAGAGRPRPQVLLVFVLGVAVMRAAGCVINDFTDRNIDPHVQRTRDRPLAARRVSPSEALLLFALLLAVALYLVTRLDLLTVKLACIGALLTVSYPLFKRFFPMPQLYLGISFGGWSVPMAFAAQSGALPRVAGADTRVSGSGARESRRRLQAVRFEQLLQLRRRFPGSLDELRLVVLDRVLRVEPLLVVLLEQAYGALGGRDAETQRKQSVARHVEARWKGLAPDELDAQVP